MTFLAPCPFCGASNVELEAGPEYNHWPAVRCNECGALGPSITIDHGATIAKWNRRAALINEDGKA